VGYHAPHHPTSTRGPQGKGGVSITMGSVTFGYGVNSRITVEMLQRIAGNEAKVTLEGYCVHLPT
jgi:hypothetical protein